MPKKQSYWSKGRGKQHHRRRPGGDRTIQDTFDRYAAMKRAAEERWESRRRLEQEQARLQEQTGLQQEKDGATIISDGAALPQEDCTTIPEDCANQLPAFDFDPQDQDDPQAEGTAYLDRVEAGLSPWWSDKF